MLLDDMNACGVRGTFLIVGWVAERCPRLVSEIVSAGHELGSHGHLHRRVYEMSREEFRRDLQRSLRAISDTGGSNIHSFRAPEWSITRDSLWALEELAGNGITVDASMAPLELVGDVGYPRRAYVRHTVAGDIVEMPPLVADRFGQTMPMGWGWGLRMSSPARVRHTIDKMNETGAPAVITVHPWEIDPNPPFVALPLRLRFAHYFRLAGFRERLRDVMRHGRFGTLKEAAASVA
jgi:polysaccharide deacetylase family protein (PEP-CTERM system associated)